MKKHISKLTGTRTLGNHLVQHLILQVENPRLSDEKGHVHGPNSESLPEPGLG